MKLRSASREVAFQQATYVKASSKNISEFTPEFFDESSRAWKANKIEVTKGIFKYKKEEASTPRRSARLLTASVQVKETPGVVSGLRRSARLATNS
jgi:hypothetical protein